MATLRAIQRDAVKPVDFGAPASRRSALTPAAAPAPPRRGPLVTHIEGGEKREPKREPRDRDNEILGKQSGSQSNSAAPRGDMLHPTDRATFDQNEKRRREREKFHMKQKRR